MGKRLEVSLRDVLENKNSKEYIEYLLQKSGFDLNRQINYSVDPLTGNAIYTQKEKEN